MTDTRTAMLQRIRAAVAAGEPANPAPPIPRDYQRSGTHPAGSAVVVELLTDRLVDYQAHVQHCTADRVAGAVAEILSGTASIVIPPGLPADITAGCGDTRATVTVDRDPEPLTPQQLDGIEVVVTAARVAIAVTGTIILDAAPDQGRRAITLVPDRHLVVLRAEQIVETVPEGIARLTPTAALTLISGPSATSDIELSRVEGVHGPRNLHVLIVR